jgi:hypothetical protein
LKEGIYGKCWEQHARDLDAERAYDGAYWATCNARIAFGLSLHSSAD